MQYLSRYIIREAAAHASAGFVVVLGVFLMTRLSSLLSDAVTGSLPGDVVLELLVLRTIMALPSLMPAVLYLGVLLGIGRLSSDSELVALEACGISPGRVHAAVLIFGIVAAGVIAFLSFTGRPWAAARFNAVRDDAVAKAGIEDLTPGVFVELDSEEHDVVFAESRSVVNPQYLENVFIQRRAQEGTITILSAKRAAESRDRAAGLRFLTLYDGIQYDLDLTGKRQEVTRYETLTLRGQIPRPEPDLGPERTLSIGALMRSDDLEARAELQWRSAMPISALLLSLLAIPLARTEPRRGRYANAFPALLLYIGYRSLLSTAKSWVSDGILPALPGLWLIHATCLLIVVLLLWRPSLMPTLRWPRLATPASS
jgi:lipopolysaccharide export system permease protein